ncbi:Holliday junction resolvase RecU [Erysipelotrichaceae bacterium OH741_COT-311]|nr:Holliday junction resolvase RecU [Erysipelotrichaceae bacterium OH741_COT-311]
MIHYPKGIKKTQTIKLKESFSKRGMILEDDINITNQYYLDMDIANIHKKPTPITIVNVDYPNRSSAKITEAYFKTPSTTDYNGIYRGKAIDFECKECNSKTSFPFASIHIHQIEHLKRVIKHGGIGFIIIRFKYYQEVYFIQADKFIEQYDNYPKKSLPYQWFQANGHLIPFSLTPPIDYLKVIDALYFKETTHEK